MKGAFETYLLLLLGMTFVLLGFSMVETTIKYNRARLYQETIISLIERHNRYDVDVKDLIKQSKQKCKNCSFTVNQFEDKFIVDVNFEVKIPVINYFKTASIKSLTQSIH